MEMVPISQIVWCFLAIYTQNLPFWAIWGGGGGQKSGLGSQPHINRIFWCEKGIILHINTFICFFNQFPGVYGSLLLKNVFELFLHI